MKRSIRKKLLTKPPQAPPACPHHAQNSPCRLVKNGGRKRRSKTDEGAQAPSLRVQRYYCKTHRASVTWIPSQLLPHVHYAAPVVNEHVWRYVDGYGSSGDSGPPHPKTVKRWVRRLTKNLSKLPNKIQEALGVKETHKEERKPLNSREQKLKLLQTWGLLKLLSQTMPENRVPYHYLYGLCRSDTRT